MNVVPGFLRKDAPRGPDIPPTREHHPSTTAFLDEHNRLREDMNYYKQEAEQLVRELRVARDTIARLEDELNFVRNDRDRIFAHDASMLRSMRSIKVLICDAEQDARDSEYAPPGTGTQKAAEPVTEQDAKLLEGISKALTEPQPEQQRDA